MINSVIAFQITYAVSIHKAQGLEYDSAKVVITEEIDEMITHNIFYTAITRAIESLKVYWTPESQQYVISHFESHSAINDAVIFLPKTGIKRIRRR
ncbi:helicase C-terminal domain-containing protein [Lachnoclostridium sp.]|uniref:helicase C-terminal domain-containing protein n=1 Tax=Lachnoclostridium sp. TaxID=2028282 RepID=UPI0028964C6E|nr:helicase C-terminal domain-containing protein [Lachnoclostridium sp.]